jgi:cellulose biosynthesis protein BcsQ
MTIKDPAGRLFTFYSYKGGTGRSMTVANIAWILASNGKRVLVMDWDLEAPSLHRYFRPFLVDKDLSSTEGIIDFLLDFAVEALTPSDTPTPDWYLPYADIGKYAVSLDWEFPFPGTLDLVGAGRQGPSYGQRVRSFNWQTFYDRLGGGMFLEAAKERMRSDYDYVLIDSRTGIGDTSGICTVQLPDVLVVCFTLTGQSIDGAAAVATAASEQRQESHNAPLRVFPVPMRVEMAERDMLDKARSMASQKFDSFLDYLQNREQYWRDVEFMYVPYYAYNEVLSAVVERPSEFSLLASSERLLSYLTNGEVTQSTSVSAAERELILKQYL